MVNQFTVIEGQHNRRPDIVIFVNGLPLAVMELKNAADEEATIWDAFNQLDDAFNGTEKVLKEQLDPRMLKFKAASPDFYNSYFAARKIVDNRGRNGKNGHAQPTPPQPS